MVFWGGLIGAIVLFLVGIVAYITIIRISFGRHYFKIGSFLFKPFGHSFVKFKLSILGMLLFIF